MRYDIPVSFIGLSIVSRAFEHDMTEIPLRHYPIEQLPTLRPLDAFVM